MKNVKNGYYINGEIYVNSYDEFMETIENESLGNDEFSYLTIYPNKNGKLTFLGNNEGEVGGEIDTVDEDDKDEEEKPEVEAEATEEMDSPEEVAAFEAELEKFKK